MPSYRIIVNPTSGRGTGGKSIPAIEGLLQQAGFEFDMVQTERPWHAVELAERAVADGCQVVVAAGGDGTANEVLNGLMRARQSGGGRTAALGLISVGRGNDFAHGIHVPPGVEAGCRILVEDRRTAIDVGRVAGGLHPEGRFFGNGVGIGFDAVVGFEALKLRPLSGYPSYLVAALKTIFLYFRAPKVRVEMDAGDMTLDALMVSTMNGRRLGGGFHMAPQGDMSDGLFDVCLVEQVSRARVFALISHFTRGTQAGQAGVHMARTAALRVTALSGVLPAHADGETLCVDGTRLEMQILPRQLEVITGYRGAA
ncbi:MAG: hypothetical protein A2Y93_12510 [Chloroflexi bacterium RBG_13_68_17]|nr:MAG: hypothetical protein A2Y93_12510 [Chloroflexi bacterium RBG_13_68_17]